MKHINLTTSREQNNAIIGKIIKGISYLRGDYCQEPQLIITFTDDTYIFLTVEEDENNYNMVTFKNDNITPLECYSNAHVT